MSSASCLWFALAKASFWWIPILASPKLALWTQNFGCDGTEHLGENDLQNYYFFLLYVNCPVSNLDVGLLFVDVSNNAHLLLSAEGGKKFLLGAGKESWAVSKHSVPTATTSLTAHLCLTMWNVQKTENQIVACLCARQSLDFVMLTAQGCQHI